MNLEEKVQTSSELEHKIESLNTDDSSADGLDLRNFGRGEGRILAFSGALRAVGRDGEQEGETHQKEEEQRLQRPRMLRHLNLRSCRVGPGRGAASLALALRANDRIESIDLSQNALMLVSHLGRP